MMSIEIWLSAMEVRQQIIFTNRLWFAGKPNKEIKMGKGKDAKKAIKTPPTKTAKEKRAEKKLKKANRD